MNFDVFNGDADGLCALHQLRLAQPRDAILVTGVKRDIALLERVDAAAGDQVTVLDVSLAANRAALERLLARGARIRYVDHHDAGSVPSHPGLDATIDTTPDTCTSLIVDRTLGGRYRSWAIVGAYGDNLIAAADRAADRLALPQAQRDALRMLGEALNYNAYGDREQDLRVHPADLYRALQRHDDPLRFVASEPVFAQLRDGRLQDLALAATVAASHATASAAAFVLPDAAWARRVRGALGNRLASENPRRAHAVLTPNDRGGYTVSVRAPVATMRGALALVRQFDTGGGREAAAGINHLPAGELSRFIERFEAAFGAG
ncbi:MAG TPA: acetyltransferase [Burkholderiaceae bacterium]|nr:acetyltransferase [Burkholderiaceae bacterium]